MRAAAPARVPAPSSARPIPQARRRAARRKGSAPRLDPSDPPSPDAIVREMQDAGAIFEIRHTPERGFYYAFGLRADADAARCRLLAAKAKARSDLPLIRVAIFVAIMRGGSGS